MSSTVEALPIETAAAASARAVAVPACLPGFLVVGPQRTATTWLHRYFEARGDVGLPAFVKETFYFDRHWGKGRDWYVGRFRADSPHDLAVEVAPTYFHSPEAPRRVRKALGPIPIVITLRDPVDRTVSLWHHMKRYGMTRLPLEEAMERVPELLETGRYAHHVGRWIDTFGRERVLVLFHEQLVEDPDAFVGAICEHVGMPMKAVPESLRGHRENASRSSNGVLAWAAWKAGDALRAVGAYGLIEKAKAAGLKKLVFGKPGAKPLPDAEADVRTRIRDHFRPEMERLEELLAVDLAAWK